MKKSISAILVAALMLFAFTACQQEPIDVNGYVPAALSISYNGNGVLGGQPFDPADFSGTITYKNGQTAPYTGTFKLENDAKTYSLGNNTVTAAIVSVSGSTADGVSATCNVVGYEPTSITLENLPETAVSKSGSVTLDLSDVTAIVSYGDGETVTLAYEDEFLMGAEVKGNVGAEVKVSPSGLYIYKVSTNYISKVADLDWTVEIVEASVDHKAITEIKAVALADSTAKTFYGDSVLDKSLYKVTGTDGTAEWTLDDSEYNIILAGGTDNSGRINTTTSASVVVYIQATGEGNEGIAKSFAGFTVIDPVVDIKVIDSTGAEVTGFGETNAVERNAVPTIPSGFKVQTLTASKNATTASDWTDLNSGYYFSVPVLNGSGSTQTVNVSYKTETNEVVSTPVTFTFKTTEG